MATYTSKYPPAYNSTYIKATTDFGAGWYPYLACNPANSLIGAGSGNSWVSNGVNTNQRFHIDLGEAFIIRRIYLENYHNSGGDTNTGAKSFTFQGSNSATAFAELTYATDTNWTNLTISLSQLAQHPASNTSDPQYAVVTNTTAYRYYALKFADDWGNAYMGIRRVELQIEDNPGGGQIFWWG